MRLIICFALLSVLGCSTSTQNGVEDIAEYKTEFTEALQKHLTAVENKDLAALKSTLLEGSNLYLILPDGSITKTAEEFYAG